MQPHISNIASDTGRAQLERTSRCIFHGPVCKDLLSTAISRSQVKSAVNWVQRIQHAALFKSVIKTKTSFARHNHLVENHRSCFTVKYRRWEIIQFVWK